MASPASFALAIIMLPLIARATQEVLLLVPASLREAAHALGVSRWRTVLGVVLPTARGGILDGHGARRCTRRGRDRSADLLCSRSITPMCSLNPFGTEGLAKHPRATSSLLPRPHEASGFARAWGAAFVLLAFILLANIAARALNAAHRCPDDAPSTRRSGRSWSSPSPPAGSDPHRSAA